jgi:hypothetical protein
MPIDFSILDDARSFITGGGTTEEILQGAHTKLAEANEYLENIPAWWLE